ncbi:hypothetical protein [Thalassolituus oleivorans]|uniref:Uncharacterized protein n=1 Tax=Thalassolituus oleivorans MIL-1 TaxID=1298593 RepID=M5DP36_9GAMM|nr:hypothetical protein [Thalassolituus oleivorans]CCU71710.1 hypothetical protein TOL_1282 [Thalassolituus oleivorans MIL-1]
MTNVDLPKRPAELDDVLSLYEELHLVYRSLDSLYEFVEYHLVSKDALLAAPLVCIIRDRLARAGLRYEDIFAVPNGEQMFVDR